MQLITIINFLFLWMFGLLMSLENLKMFQPNEKHLCVCTKSFLQHLLFNWFKDELFLYKFFSNDWWFVFSFWTMAIITWMHLPFEKGKEDLIAWNKNTITENDAFRSRKPMFKPLKTFDLSVVWSNKSNAVFKLEQQKNVKIFCLTEICRNEQCSLTLNWVYFSVCTKKWTELQNCRIGVWKKNARFDQCFKHCF